MGEVSTCLWGAGVQGKTSSLTTALTLLLREGRLLVAQGQAVEEGQEIAELSQPGLAEDLDAAEARTAAARAALDTLQAGGRSSDRAELQGTLKRLRAQRDAAQRNVESLQRLQQSQAATPFEVQQAQQLVSGNQPVEVLPYFVLHCLLRRTINRGVALLLFAIA